MPISTTYETLGHMIIQELINVREDFKCEIRRLGDRLEKCLNVQASTSDEVRSVVKSSAKAFDSSADAPLTGSFVPVFDACEDMTDMQQERDNYSCSEPTKQDFSSVASSIETKLPEVPEDSLVIQKERFSASSENQEIQETLMPKSEAEEHKLFPTSSVLKVEDSLAEDTSSDSVPAHRILNFPSYPVYPHFNLRRKNLEDKFAAKHKSDEKLSVLKKKKFPIGLLNSNIGHKFRRSIDNQFSSMQTFNINKHTCGICSKSFSSSSNKVRHMRLHTGVNPFVCDKCGLKFNRKDSLKRHLQVHARKLGSSFNSEEFGEIQDMSSGASGTSSDWLNLIQSLDAQLGENDAEQ